MNDTIRMSCSGSPGWGFLVDLTAGRVQVWAGRERRAGTLTSGEIQRLRELAAPVHAAGDVHVHTQFATGEERWEIVLGERTTTLTYINESGSGLELLRLSVWAWELRQRLI
jgi:hypothetical protein